MKYYFANKIKKNGNLCSNAIQLPHLYSRWVYHVKDYTAKKKEKKKRRRR